MKIAIYRNKSVENIPAECVEQRESEKSSSRKTLLTT